MNFKQWICLIAFASIVGFQGNALAGGGGGGAKKDVKVCIQNCTEIPICVIIDVKPEPTWGPDECEKQGGKMLNAEDKAEFKVKAGNHTAYAATVVNEQPFLAEKMFYADAHGDDVKLCVYWEEDQLVIKKKENKEES